ncbi:hypothetical protein D3C80_2223680 [compost metagenome]
MQQANARRSYEVQPVQADNLVEQQRIADAFWREGLLPKTVDAHAVTLFEPRVSQ